MLSLIKETSEKNSLRHCYRQKRRSFVAKYLEKERNSSSENLSIHKKIVERLSEVLAEKKGFWATYSAYGSEVNLHGLSNVIPQINWAYPLIDEGKLRFFIPDKQNNLVSGAFDILEPNPRESKEVLIEDLQGILIPGLAFDSFGGRLGQGKGFYDRALQNFKGLKVAVAYSIQLAKSPLPMFKHDVAMDLVVTELGVLTPQ